MIDVLGFLHKLWEFFWKHDQFFAMIILGIFWFRKIKKIECVTNIQADIYKRAIVLFTSWSNDRFFLNIRLANETDEQYKNKLNSLEKINLKNERDAHKIFDQLSICGGKNIKKWITLLKKSSNMNKLWITDENIKDFIYLIRKDMGMTSLYENFTKKL